ncbi:MAG: sodium/proline symporter PutP [Clostridiales bacterium]|nr:sodium/proline symporter PutP [Clostridiales bacterium]
MNTSQICILIAIILYLIAMIYVGVAYSRKSAGSTDDFYLGGRHLSPLVAAMSAEASDMSSWLLMGLPGVAYFTGLADATWTAIGLAVGTYLNWLFVAKRLRLYSAHIGAITVPDFFARRFHDEKKVLLGISAVIIIIFFIPYTASGFAAVGKLFNSLFGVDYMTAMLVGAAVIILYTVMGGFLAVSTTDLIQSIVMTIALIVVLFFGINAAGGWGAVQSTAASIPGYLSLHSVENVVTGSVSNYGFITICSTLAWGLGYFGMPHILLRFMAIEDEKKIKTSRRIATVWVVISMAVAILIGTVGLAVSKAGGIPAFESASAAEAVIVKIADLLSRYGVLAALLAGIVLAGILASTMSTADSQLLAASSSVSENLMRDVFGIKMSQKATMWTARITVVVIAILGVLIARNPNSSVFAIVSFAWAGFGATFAPVMLLSLFWKRTNKWGALSGMIVGGAMVFIWKYLVRPLGGAWNVYELLPAFLLACLAIVIVSLLTPAPDKAVVEEFEHVRELNKKIK